MGMLLKLVVFWCLEVQAAEGVWFTRCKTCLCSYKIGTGTRAKTSDAVENSRHCFGGNTCSSMTSRCPNDCHVKAKSYLLNPDSNPKGKDKVCQIYGPTTQGVPVYSGSKASSCQSYPIYKEIVPADKICCYRKCRSCQLYYVRGGKFTRLSIAVGSPQIDPSYDCTIKETTLCEEDCNNALSSSSSFGSKSVDDVSGSKVCTAVGTKIPPPGVKIKVSYNINDGHSHSYDVPGGNVCCGCTCRMSVTYQGRSRVLSVSLTQDHAKKFFSCGSQASRCRSLCRDDIKKNLASDSYTLEGTLGYNVCKIYDDTASTKPGLVVYSEYDIGNGYIKDKMDDFCCLKLAGPPYVVSYNC